ncbi:hypothetical protein J3R30DRAFT_2745404 [Lentinula aciculospora]|uniref:Uncharacterized protein n=1 Tax=Lentinula aciculospora TaxID=153920 RepID=A0A9W9DPE4_9AGAR|nr:hypothetical protein J3R30DRAFT_2745404 [Lentinula aciculospora]
MPLLQIQAMIRALFPHTENIALLLKSFEDVWCVLWVLVRVIRKTCQGDECLSDGFPYVSCICSLGNAISTVFFFLSRLRVTLAKRNAYFLGAWFRPVAVDPLVAVLFSFHLALALPIS